MKTSKAIKTATLACFSILLISFIAFKSGSFDAYLRAEGTVSENGDRIDTPFTNFSKVHDPVKISPTMLSTSKSMTLIEQKEKFPVAQKKEFPLENILREDSLKKIPK